MKRMLLLIAAALMICGCGGTYSVASGRDDTAQLSFTADKSYSITVAIDGAAYEMTTVEQQAYRARKMKETAQNTITIATGQHKVEATKDGKTLYSKTIFVSTGQHKIIEL